MAIDQYSLVSLESVKQFIGKLGSNTDDDDLICDIIDSVSASFESYCDRNFLTREYVEYYDGKGNSRLYTNQSPLTAITSIWQDRDWTWDDATLISGTNYRIVNSRYITFKNVTLLDNIQNIKVSYTAGYAETPFDLSLACITEIARVYKHRHEVDTISKSLADGSVSFVTTDFLDGTITTLKRYRRLTIA